MPSGGPAGAAGNGAHAGPAPPAVELRAVAKVYTQYEHRVHALRGVSLAIRPGEFVSVVGPSGSGKSTLLHMLGLLDRPTEGEVLVEGRPTSPLPGAAIAAFRGKRIGFVFQGANLLARFTALDNVLLPALLQGERREDAKPRALALLERVGVGHRADHKGVHLSGGEQQRVAIARALINEPALVLADEPTGSLDSASSAEVVGLFRELHAEGRTMVLVTHDPALARRAPRRVEVRDGQVVRDAAGAAGAATPAAPAQPRTGAKPSREAAA